MSIAVKTRNFISLRLRGAIATACAAGKPTPDGKLRSPRTVYHLQRAQHHLKLGLAALLSEPVAGKTYHLPQDLIDYENDCEAFAKQEQE